MENNKGATSKLVAHVKITSDNHSAAADSVPFFRVCLQQAGLGLLQLPSLLGGRGRQCHPISLTQSNPTRAFASFGESTGQRRAIFRTLLGKEHLVQYKATVFLYHVVCHVP